ncbi:MAG: endolytic transglycosylase MltG [Methylophilaceae bacterium]
MLVLLAIIAMAGWVIYFAKQPVNLPTTSYDLVLKHGSSLRGIAQQMVREGILAEPWTFIFLIRAQGLAGDIKAGNYELRAGMTNYDLFLMITDGITSQRSIVFIEGWTFAQVREALNRHEDVRHLSMPMTNEEILRQIGATENVAEGLFFPDSYFFDSGMSDLDILKRAYETMQRKLAKAWEGRAPGLPYRTPYEALIMASIVEKETGLASERPMIASVFLNRLRIGMRLQTDPTVIYGLGETFDGNLRKRDLLQDNEYNTYTRSGLPPTPIAMPGMAAIEAALHPAQSKALYFVGKGDGSHAFSSSLHEHNRAVTRYQLRRN